MKTGAAFADYCCELLVSAGPLQARRMFGGFGISTGGLTFAIVADLGGGPKLWLKANENTRPLYEQAGCERFTYPMKGVLRSMDYYSAPEDAMESPQLMAPWALQALDCALKARTATRSQAKRATPPAKRAAAPAPKAKASRKSARG